MTAVKPPPPFSHIHGLGIDPSDRALYVATHGGLYRVVDGRGRIVANRYQDTMGFAVVGPNHFIGSGHPDMREELPPSLGFMESRDAGKTWIKKSLLGEADFHALRSAHDLIWAYDATSSKLMVSSDGRDWRTRSTVLLTDFVVSPWSPDDVVAANGETLRRSKDGGRSWKKVDGPGGAVFLAWDKKRGLHVVTASGTLFMSKSGEGWRRRGSIGGQPGALLVEGKTIYAATHDRVLASNDNGATWEAVFTEADRG